MKPQDTRDLAKLSQVVNHILNTPDLYDLNNLAKAGTCGEYAVFLRDTLEKRLLSFQAEVDDEGTVEEVVYQSPKAGIADKAVRERVCKQIASTMITLMATVVACLGSIQVASRPGLTAFAPAMAAPQSGGGTMDVNAWLIQNRFLELQDTRKVEDVEYKFLMSPTQRLGRTQIYLTLQRSDGVQSIGTMRAEGGDGAGLKSLPSGTMRVSFLNPIVIPQATGVIKTVLPVRVFDVAGMPWFAGVLLPGDQSIFKSFYVATPHLRFTDGIEGIYRKVQEYDVSTLSETRMQIAQASLVYDMIRRDPDTAPELLTRILGSFFQTHLPGYQPPITGAAPGVPGIPSVPAPAPGAAYLPYQPVVRPTITPGAQQIPGIPPVFDTKQLYHPVARPFAPAAVLQPGVVLRPTLAFDIPYTTTTELQKQIKRFSGSLSQESSPATVRAYMLATEELANRTVRTSICRDLYWMHPDLSRVYPWATFQLLAVKDITKLGDRMSTRFTPQWMDFLEGLQKAYQKIGLTLDLPPAGMQPYLDQLRVRGLETLPLCKSGGIAGYKEVQDGLLRLQGLYEEHVKKVWALLNSLVMIVVDPETKTEVVKLHPKVLAPGTSSQKYVESVADKARDIISEFYVDVEAAYVDAIMNIQAKIAV